ncbi:MAG: hypothetical protein IJ574_06100 [Bacilli bacterium]|nr:hypothetical protein [Bacilli bacterium]
MIKGRKLNVKTKKNSNKVVMIATLVMAVGVIVISGVTYALWNTTEKQDGFNQVNISCLDLVVSDNKPINLVNAYQLSDNEALEQVPYSFKITNHCNNSEFVDIKLDLKSTNTLALTDIKAVLKSDITYIEPVTINNLLDDTTDQAGYSAKHLITTEVSGNTTKEYKLYLWIKEDAAYESISNKQFEGKIDIVNHNGNILATDYVRNLSSSDTTTLAYDETVDNNLRYVGATPNNYVNFNGELWRIIGVMNNVDNGTGVQESRIKLIRDESLGNYPFYDECADENWTDNGDGTYTCSSYRYSNNWPNSTANEVLNIYYNSGTHAVYHGNIFINNNWVDYQTSSVNFTNNGLNSTSKSLIGTTTYYLGGYTWDDNGTYDLKTLNTVYFYTAERINNPINNYNTLIWNGILGLMYPSDYGYASNGNAEGNNCKMISLNKWHEQMYATCKNNDWVYDSSIFQSTMTPRIDTYYNISYISSFGYVHINDSGKSFGIRPVLYLKSTVKIVNDGQNGSSSKPYNLSL